MFLIVLYAAVTKQNIYGHRTHGHNFPFIKKILIFNVLNSLHFTKIKSLFVQNVKLCYNTWQRLLNFINGIVFECQVSDGRKMSVGYHASCIISPQI